MRELVPAWPPGAQASATNVRETLGAAVDRRGQAGRPGAEHHDVEALPVDVGAQPEVARHLRRGGVAQHLLGRCTRIGVSSRGMSSQSRNVVALSSVSTSQELHRQQVALQQVAHLEGPPRAALGDQPQHAVPGLLVPRPPRQHAGQHDLAELGRRRQHRSQRRAVEGDHLALGSAATHSAGVGSPVKVAMSPRKVPASASAIHISLPGLWIEEVDAPLEQHVERRVALALRVQDLAGFEALQLALLAPATRSCAAGGGGT